MEEQISKQNSPVQSLETQVVIKTKNPVNWLLISSIAIFVLVTLLLIGTLGYLLGTNKNTTKVANQVTPTAIPTPTPTIDPTTNWQTYTSLNGFSFKYPADWQQYKSTLPDNKEITLLAPNPYASPNCSSQQLPSCNTQAFWVSVIDNPNKLSLQDYINSEGLPLNSSFVKNSSSLGIPYDWVINRNAPGADTVEDATINYKQKFINIGCFKSICNDQLFDQILSTFKFTDQTQTGLTDFDLTSIKQALALHDNVSPNQIIMDLPHTSKYSDQYASGNYGYQGVGGGAMWFAAKINNQWRIIFTGNGAIPNCSDIAQYNPPKDFLPCN